MNAKTSLKTRLARFVRTTSWGFKLSFKLPPFFSIEISMSRPALKAANDNRPTPAFNKASRPKRVA